MEVSNDYEDVILNTGSINIEESGEEEPEQTTVIHDDFSGTSENETNNSQNTKEPELNILDGPISYVSSPNEPLEPLQPSVFQTPVTPQITLPQFVPNLSPIDPYDPTTSSSKQFSFLQNLWSPTNFNTNNIDTSQILQSTQSNVNSNLNPEIKQPAGNNNNSRNSMINSNLKTPNFRQNSSFNSRSSSNLNQNLNTPNLNQSNNTSNLNQSNNTSNLNQNLNSSNLNQNLNTPNLNQSNNTSNLNQNLNISNLNQNLNTPNLNQSNNTSNLNQNLNTSNLNQNNFTPNVNQNLNTSNLNQNLNTSNLNQNANFTNLNKNMNNLKLNQGANSNANQNVLNMNQNSNSSLNQSNAELSQLMSQFLSMQIQQQNNAVDNQTIVTLENGSLKDFTCTDDECENLDIWIDNFRSQAVTHKWNDFVTVQKFSSLLKQGAWAWFCNFRKDYSTLDQIDPNVMIQTFYNYFLPKDMFQRITHKLKTNRKTDKETLVNYIANTELLMLQLENWYGKDLDDISKCKYISDGLKDSSKLKEKFQSFMTLGHSYEKSITELKKFDGIQQSRVRIQNSEKENRICQICNSTAHTANYCPEFLKKNPNTNFRNTTKLGSPKAGPPKTPQKTSNGFKCYTCGSTQHRQAQCPEFLADLREVRAKRQQRQQETKEVLVVQEEDEEENAEFEEEFDPELFEDNFTYAITSEGDLVDEYEKLTESLEQIIEELQIEEQFYDSIEEDEKGLLKTITESNVSIIKESDPIDNEIKVKYQAAYMKMKLPFGPFDVILDNASPESLISLNLVKLIPGYEKLITQNTVDPKLIGAGGAKINIVGNINLKFSLETCDFEEDFKIVDFPDSRKTVLLSLVWIQKNRAFEATKLRSIWFDQDLTKAYKYEITNGFFGNHKLNTKYFKQACKKFGKPDVDMFSSKLNTQLTRYITKQEDAFIQSWKPSRIPYGYFNCEFKDLYFMVQKFIEDKIEKAMVVIPTWKNQRWYSQIMKMLIAEPIILDSEDTFLQASTLYKNSIKEPPTTHLIVCVSTNESKRKDFLKQKVKFLEDNDLKPLQDYSEDFIGNVDKIYHINDETELNPEEAMSLFHIDNDQKQNKIIPIKEDIKVVLNEKEIQKVCDNSFIELIEKEGNILIKFKKKLHLPKNTRIILQTKNSDTFKENLFTPTILDDTINIFPCINSEQLITIQLSNCSSKHKIFEPGSILGEITSHDVSNYETVNFIDTERKKQMCLDFENLTSEQQAILEKMIFEEFPDVFSDQIGTVKNYEAEIKLDKTISRPFLPNFRHSPKENEILSAWAKGMFEQRRTQLSKSPYNSPIFSVPKKNPADFPRIVIDSRHINNAITRMFYPITRVDEALDALAFSKYFTTIDLNSGFWQVPLTESSRQYTAFSTQSGRYEFTVLPMGFKNATYNFQKMMDTILGNYIWNICIVYVDDVIIHGKTFEELIERMRKVFTRLREFNLTCKLKKCKFGFQIIHFLGFKIENGGILPDEENIKKILEFQNPKEAKNKKRAVKSFLGMAGMYRRFIKDFALITYPLVEISNDNSTFQWNESCQIAFDKIKLLLTSPPVLVLPDFTKPFALTTDASCVAIGAVLEQAEHPVAFISRKLTKEEKNYSTPEQECLCVNWAIKKLRVYLLDNPFELQTDHKALEQMKTMQNNRKMIRWTIELSEFEYTIKHRPGKDILHADALSRAYFIEQLDEDSEAVRLLIKFQKEDKHCQKHLLELGKSVNGITHTLKNGILMRINGDKEQIFLPKILIGRIFEEFHMSRIGGHNGVSVTLNGIKKKYFWNGIDKDIKDLIEACDICQRVRNNLEKNGNLTSITVSKPFELVAMDLVGPVKPTARGNKWLLVIVEYMTKYPVVYCLQDATANSISKAFVNYISMFGTPELLLTDQGANFLSNLFTNVCSILGIKKIQTTPYHPQTDGLVERYNQTIVRYLRKLMDDNQSNWDLLVDLAVFNYRISDQKSTGVSPAKLLFGIEPNVPGDTRFFKKIISFDEGTNKRNFNEELELIREQALLNNAKAQLNQQKNYNKGQQVIEFKEGDLVLLWYPVIKKGLTKKFVKQWIGPFTVTRKISDLVYEIQIANRRIVNIVNVNKLKPYIRSNEEITDLITEVQDFEDGDTFIWEEDQFQKEERELKTISKQIQENEDFEIKQVNSQDEQPLVFNKSNNNVRKLEKIDNPQFLQDDVIPKSEPEKMVNAKLTEQQEFDNIVEQANKEDQMSSVGKRNKPNPRYALYLIQGTSKYVVNKLF